MTKIVTTDKQLYRTHYDAKVVSGRAENGLYIAAVDDKGERVYLNPRHIKYIRP